MFDSNFTTYTPVQKQKQELWYDPAANNSLKTHKGFELYFVTMLDAEK